MARINFPIRIITVFVYSEYLYTVYYSVLLRDNINILYLMRTELHTSYS